MKQLKKELFGIIETYIDSYQEQNGHAPSIMEMSVDLGIPKTTVARYLHYMTEHEMLSFEGYRKITTKRTDSIKHATIGVQVLGAVSCGLPKYAEENFEEYVRVPASWFGPGEYYALRADGDSMVKVGIDAGDLVIIKKQPGADPGQIVVALIDNGNATLKRYYPHRESNTVELRPENDSMQPQIYDMNETTITIQGIAVKVLKDLA